MGGLRDLFLVVQDILQPPQCQLESIEGLGGAGKIKIRGFPMAREKSTVIIN